jgi:cell wall-associated NlpC family hydrolase
MQIMKKIAIIIAAAIVAVSAFAQEKRWAVVNLSTVYMRAQPDYESALETQELMGTVVEIVGEKGYWREIVSPQPYKAWVTEKGLIEMSEAQLEEYKAAPKVMFAGLYGHVYTGPSLNSATVCDLVGGDLLRLYTGSGDGTEGRTARKAAKKGKWTKVQLPSGKTGWVQSGNIVEHKGFRSIAKGEGSSDSITKQETEQIIAEALKLEGVPYLWGGMSAKGVDCSGLVRISHLMNGILLPRNASQQIHCGDRVQMTIDKGFWNDRSDESAFRTEMLARTADLKRGDLVFFGTPAMEEGQKDRVTHVGIYLGNGKIIHSSHLVRINSLIPGEPDYYENAHRLLGAIRL